MGIEDAQFWWGQKVHSPGQCEGRKGCGSMCSALALGVCARVEDRTHSAQEDRQCECLLLLLLCR